MFVDQFFSSPNLANYCFSIFRRIHVCEFLRTKISNLATFEFQREKTKNGIFPKITSWENFSVIKTNSISLGTIF